MHTMENTTEALVQERRSKAVSYGDYRKKVSQWVAVGKSTGPEQTEDLANYTMRNDRRMKCFDKTAKIDTDTVTKIKSVLVKLSKKF